MLIFLSFPPISFTKPDLMTNYTKPCFAIIKLLILIELIGGTGVNAQTSKIKGSIVGIEDTPIQLWYTKNGKSAKDIVIANNDFFEYNAPTTDDNTLSLYVKGSRMFTFWLDSSIIELSGNINYPHRLNVKGGRENEIEQKYNAEVYWVYEELLSEADKKDRIRLGNEKKENTISFINSNLNRITSIRLLHQLLLDFEDEIDRFENIWNNISKDIQHSNWGTKFSKQLKNVRFQPEIGKKAPNFSISDTNGNVITLGDYEGRYVLLNFWGQWCSPCVKSYPALRTLNEKYHKQLQIIGIAAEHAKDRDKWQTTIQENNLTWIQSSEFEFDKGRINSLYNITAFPTYFLLDREGEIVLKTYSVTEVQEFFSRHDDFK